MVAEIKVFDGQETFRALPEPPAPAPPAPAPVPQASAPPAPIAPVGKFQRGGAGAVQNYRMLSFPGGLWIHGCTVCVEYIVTII